ncbi:hypothetical protein ACFFP0_24610 [Rhizobium puerariae]|uniref:XRE family transcriptional regulator n=1 Tax=Rhizobium puerariae TaxID=1585791 RepID=A0ABV6APL8_9HYPH
MAPKDFTRWLAEMKAAGLSKSDAECGRLLGVSANAIVGMKKNGTDKRTDLACRALLHRMIPYGVGE